MKSQIFKDAWKLVKLNGMKISEALRASWKAFKNGIEVNVVNGYTNYRIDPKKFVVSFRKEIGDAVYSDNMIDRICERVLNHVDYKINAQYDYGQGQYNGD